MEGEKRENEKKKRTQNATTQHQPKPFIMSFCVSCEIFSIVCCYNFFFTLKWKRYTYTHLKKQAQSIFQQHSKKMAAKNKEQIDIFNPFMFLVFYMRVCQTTVFIFRLCSYNAFFFVRTMYIVTIEMVWLQELTKINTTIVENNGQLVKSLKNYYPHFKRIRRCNNHIFPLFLSFSSIFQSSLLYCVCDNISLTLVLDLNHENNANINFFFSCQWFITFII